MHQEPAEHPEQDKGILMLQPGVWLDERRRSVWEDDHEISVTRREYEVLYMLFRNKGCVLTYEQIYTRVWKEEYYEGRNSVICLMSRLRKKLKMLSTKLKILLMTHGKNDHFVFYQNPYLP